MKNPCRLNSCYLKSCEAMTSYFVLGTGGGVFGMIAHNGLATNGSVSTVAAEALLWTSVFAWVTTLLDLLFNACGKRLFYTCAQLAFSFILFAFYTITMVTWGAKGTFVDVMNYNRALIVFILALLTTLGYLWMTIAAAMKAFKERDQCSGDKQADDGVVENGKSDEPEEQAAAEPTQEEAKAEE